MNYTLRSYSIIFVLSFAIISILIPNYVNAQSAHRDWQLGVISPEVVDALYNEKIGDQSTSGDLEQDIAPPPIIITTSGGDIYLLNDGGVKAKLKINEKGILETTYNLEGSNAKMIDEFGNEFTYQYNADGKTVNVVNSQGEIVRTENYELGKIVSFAKQGNVTYQYDDNDILLSSTDEWGNVTLYKDGHASEIIDSDGNNAGSYKYNGGILESFTDRTGSITYFAADGIRPVYTTNAENTVTQVYNYDDRGHLTTVVNNVSQQVTSVEEGAYSVVSRVNDETGEEVVTEVYNYDAAGDVSSVTNIAANGVVTGWTEYDGYGRVIAAYNAEGLKVQVYEYNSHNFLQQTVGLGGVDPISGQQTILTYTLFDAKGRPAEVWQQGDGDNMVKIQEYKYKENGLLDETYSLGIKRDEEGNAVILGGNFVYVRLSKTVYDDKNRPKSVYAIVHNENGDYVDEEGNVVTDVADAKEEIQQKYKYDSDGFMVKTYSYGNNGRCTGSIEYDSYSRADKGYNSQGIEIQEYIYGEDGLLDKTISKGDGGEEDVVLGWTVYSAASKPTESYNQSGSLTQKYLYDKNGLLVKTLNFNSADEVGGIVASLLDDLENIADLWNDDWDTLYSAAFGDLSSETLTVQAWIALDEGDTEKALACALKCIKLYSDTANAQQKALDEQGGQTDNIAANYALNDVGTCYFILGNVLESRGMDTEAASAYKIQASEYSGAQAFDPNLPGTTNGGYWLVSDASKEKLGVSGLNIDLPVATGYTVFGGDSKPTSVYSYYSQDGGELHSVKMQDYVYSYTEDIKDDDGNVVGTRTLYSSFVQKTINYGDFAEIIGSTTNPEVTAADLALLGSLWDSEWDRQYDFSNMTVESLAFEALLALDQGDMAKAKAFALKCIFTYSEQAKQQQEGLSELPTSNTDIAGNYYLNNVGSSLFVLGQALESEGNTEGAIVVYKIQALDYSYAYVLDSSGTGYDLVTDASKIRLEALGALDQITPQETANTTSAQVQTSYTLFDDYGRQDKTFNSDGELIQRYSYSRNGFLVATKSYGLGGRQTGTTIFDKYSRPLASFNFTGSGALKIPTELKQVIDSGITADQLDDAEFEQWKPYLKGLTQTFAYGTDGFLDVSNSWGQATEVNVGKIFQFSNAYNSAKGDDKYLLEYDFNDDGLINEQDLAIFDNQFSGAAQIMADYTAGVIGKEELNDFAKTFGSERVKYSPIFNGTTEYDSYGKADKVFNAEGCKVQEYAYNQLGFMEQSRSFSPQRDSEGEVQYTQDANGNDVPIMVQTSYTEFDAYSKPVSTHNLYDNGDDGLQNAMVQEYVYDKGFLVQTNTFGRNNLLTGYALYDSYGRQTQTYNFYTNVSDELINAEVTAADLALLGSLWDSEWDR